MVAVEEITAVKPEAVSAIETYAVREQSIPEAVCATEVEAHHPPTGWDNDTTSACYNAWPRCETRSSCKAAAWTRKARSHAWTGTETGAYPRPAETSTAHAATHSSLRKG